MDRKIISQAIVKRTIKSSFMQFAIKHAKENMWKTTLDKKNKKKQLY